MLEILIYILIVLIPFYCLIKLKQLKESFFLNLKYWLLCYSYFYLLIPNLFLEFTNKYYEWNFSKNILWTSKFYSTYFVVILFFISILKKDKIVTFDKDFKINKFIQVICKLIFIISVFLLSYILIKYGTELFSYRYDRMLSEKYFNEIVNKYRLKAISFLLLSTTTILYWNNKKMYNFLPLILIVIFEFIGAARTYSFLAIIFIYINIALVNKKIYFFKITGAILFVLSFVTIYRIRFQPIAQGINKTFIFVYLSLGEFIHTYMTLPYILSTTQIGTYKYDQAILNLISGVLPGFLKVKLTLTQTLGSYLAKDISRGYGLASNIVTETIYYNGEIIYIFVVPIFILLILLVDNFLFKLQFKGYVFKLILICYLRLIFREGIVLYLFTIIYIYCLYFNFCLFIKSKFYEERHIESNKSSFIDYKS